jgi:Holliday junction resolvase RusA-like endonuclease
MKDSLPNRGVGRSPHRRASLIITIPPSVNRAWVNVPGKGRARSAEYNRWREDAGWTIRAARIAKITGHVAIRIRAGVPARRRDLDNITKPILDALTAFGVIEDDGLAHRITSEWSAGVESGLVEVEIRQFSGPETRHRITIAVSARHAAHRAAQPAGLAAAA